MESPGGFPRNHKSAAAYLLQVARSSEGRRYRKQPKIDALRAPPTPRRGVQIRQSAVLRHSSTPILRPAGFEDEDDDEDEDEATHENARRRSWKRTAGPLARP